TNIGDKIFLNWSDTIWLTGLAFGIMHLQYHHFQVNLVSIVQMSYTFVMGLLLGVIRVGTKSVVQPMFVHSAFNSIFNLILTAVP
ncbi:MAG: CPBP family intramembrane metalloprotease, partial [Anaerolineales bacterium]|nr:CPBP family intramembrane metalloprotease [Anaerolineales bacterium]